MRKKFKPQGRAANAVALLGCLVSLMGCDLVLPSAPQPHSSSSPGEKSSSKPSPKPSILPSASPTPSPKTTPQPSASPLPSPLPSPKPSPTPTPSTAPAGDGFVATVGPADLFPSDSFWYKDVSQLPIASESAGIIGATTWGDAGKMRITVSFKLLQINASTPKKTFTAKAAYLDPDPTVSEADADPVPYPLGGSLEEESGYRCVHDGDCHLMVVDMVQRKLFELWRANNSVADGSGTWTMDDETVWLMDGHYDPVKGRGLGCTSADAAGFSLAAGMLGIRELAAGTINHALRLVLPNPIIRSRTFVAPATHFAGGTSTAGPPYGTRFRLKSTFNETPFAGQTGVLAIIHAMKKHGMILADAGQDALTAESDEMYTDPNLKLAKTLGDPATVLNSIKPIDFEIVDFPAGNPSTTSDCRREPAPPVTPR